VHIFDSYFFKYEVNLCLLTELRNRWKRIHLFLPHHELWITQRS